MFLYHYSTVFSLQSSINSFNFTGMALMAVTVVMLANRICFLSIDIGICKEKVAEDPQIKIPLPNHILAIVTFRTCFSFNLAKLKSNLCKSGIALLFRC